MDSPSIGASGVEKLQKRLAPFLSSHGRCTIIEQEEEGFFLLKEPWNDETVSFIIRSEDNEIIDALNSVFLPERFAAIYHKDESKLEVIYTVFPPTGARADIAKRMFKFSRSGKSYNCYFGASSDKLLKISKHFAPASGAGPTNYRNLSQYSLMTNIADGTITVPPEIKEQYDNSRAISFWIEPVTWVEEDVYDLVNHLNFFMYYFDRETPTIMVHTPASEGRVPNPQTRYIRGSFPERIDSVAIDLDLLHFWQASIQGDSARRFLHSFQIIEYAAYYMIEEQTNKTIRRLLASPDTSSRAPEIASQIFDAFSQTKLTDAQKIEMVINRFVDPAVVWDAIIASKEVFSSEISFDGGYTQPSLIKPSWELPDFKQNWPGPFASAIRNLRNALSHGREQRMAAVVTPTHSNMTKLQPWVPLVAAAAREIMVYRTTL